MARILVDFKCGYCGNVDEKLVDSETQVITCSKCNNESFRKLSAPSSFNFKGTGFYETDFKNK